MVGGLQALGGAVCVDIRSGQEFAQSAVLAHVLVAPPRKALEINPISECCIYFFYLLTCCFALWWGA